MGLPRLPDGLPESDELLSYVSGRFSGTGWEVLGCWQEAWPGGVFYTRIFLRRAGPKASRQEIKFQAQCVRYVMEKRTDVKWVVLAYPEGRRALRKSSWVPALTRLANRFTV